jgi:hypothetical protein
MKKNQLKDQLISELNSIDLPISEKLASTSIETKAVAETKMVAETNSPIETELQASATLKRKFSTKLKFAISCFCLILAVACSIVLMATTSSQPQTNASNLTSYIIDINPSFCVTTNETNEVISLFSLNNDGDVALNDDELSNVVGTKIDDCIKKIINVAVKNGFIDDNENRKIQIYAINNKEPFSEEKGAYVKGIFDKTFEEQGFNNIQIEKHTMQIEDFKERLGLENNINDLDRMKDDIVNHNKFFDPNFNPNNPV